MLLLLFTVLLFSLNCQLATSDDDDDGVVLPSKCETCKILATELQARLDETGRSRETTYAGKGKVKKYKDSDLRLLETLEGLCDRVIQYNVHKEYTDSRRFAKGQSKTMQTLHGLVAKGVQVDLGIPYELWDSPAAEVTRMKLDCDAMLENYESQIERWYHGDQSVPLIQYLCRDLVLKPHESDCLNDSVADEPEL